MWTTLLTLLPHLFPNIAAYSVGDVNPRALQGIWRLTSLDSTGLPFERSSDPASIWKSKGFLPMKEFTTFPLKKMQDATVMTTPKSKKRMELFIRLKDDMTFEQCSSLTDDDRNRDKSLEEMLQDDVARRQRESFAMKGTWDYIDGRLILASDRPEKKPFDVVYDDSETTEIALSDTILIGKVSVTSEESLTDGPVVVETVSVQSKEVDNEDNNDGSKPQKKHIDVHLSVPKGKIKRGKFMYPKHHPSFFEQPIFNPQSMGNFELFQVEGNVNEEEESEELIELFTKEDLAGKRFYLSTFPLPERKKKDRWGRIVEEETDETKLTKHLQVVALEFFQNNTFTTLRGLGSEEVRRGKWSIIGEKRDQVWIQVYRFGFGRSVSYGTFSEGMSLTQDDERTYWGKITEVETGQELDNNNNNSSPKRVEVEGAIMLGTGLEPCSIGRFRMVEMEEDIIDNDEDDFDPEEGYVSMDPEDIDENAKRFDLLFHDDDDLGNDSFGSPYGSFE